MSKLKKQLKEILPELSSEANQCRDREIKERLYLIRCIVRSKKSVVKASASVGKSTDWFTKWAKRLLKQRCLEALQSKSRKPNRSPNKTQKRVEKRVVALRKYEPFLGQERISFELKRLFNMELAPSTVGAVLRRHNLITSISKARLTKRHMKRYRRGLPGFAQMDVKYVPQLVEGKQLYQINFVDHCTTWRFTRIYPSINHETMRVFLDELLIFCPFPIIEIQTDNGQEFTDKYRGGRTAPSGTHVLDYWCRENGIRHRLIPVGEKELNGKVENTHKQDDREFYAQNLLMSLSQARIAITRYNDCWNGLRYTKALGWKTPKQALEAAEIRVLAWTSLIVSRYQKKTNELIKWDQGLNASVLASLPKAPRGQKKKARPKKLTYLDRYLQTLEWDEKKSG